MISDKSKNTIDSLPFDELREEVLKDTSSRFQGEKFDYLIARFAKLKDDMRTSEHQENIEVQREHLKTAEEANEIAEKANKYSKIALWASGFALVISILTLIASCLNK